MIIDISSDEESTPLQQSTPIKFYPLNVIQALNLSGESTVAKMGSETSMEMTASTFESGPSPYKKITFSTSPVSEGEEFRVEGQNINTTDESYFEEPDTPRQLPPLQPAPVLQDITNGELSLNEPPTKINRLDDLTEPTIEDIENVYGIDLQSSSEFNALCGRGARFTSTLLTRTRKQPVLITREIPHCPRPVSSSYRGALSRPAPGRDFSCCGGIPKFARGRGHGRITQC